jgi:hypothetical protein
VRARDGGSDGLAPDRGGERPRYRLSCEREVTGSQTFGNLRQGAESHVGQASITSHSAAHGDASDTCRDDDVDGRERITAPYFDENGSERLEGRSPRLGEQDLTHGTHAIGSHRQRVPRPSCHPP